MCTHSQVVSLWQHLLYTAVRFSRHKLLSLSCRSIWWLLSFSCLQLRLHPRRKRHQLKERSRLQREERSSTTIGDANATEESHTA